MKARPSLPVVFNGARFLEAALEYPGLEHFLADGSTDGLSGVAFLDIDDLWTPRYLSHLVNALGADPAAGIAQGMIRCFLTGEDGRNYRLSRPFRFYLPGSAVYRREVFRECGTFEESLSISEDYDFAPRCWERDVDPKRPTRVTAQEFLETAPAAWDDGQREPFPG